MILKFGDYAAFKAEHIIGVNCTTTSNGSNCLEILLVNGSTKIYYNTKEQKQYKRDHEAIFKLFSPSDEDVDKKYPIHIPKW